VRPAGLAALVPRWRRPRTTSLRLERAGTAVLRIDSGLEELRRRLEDAGIETHDTDEIVGRPRFFCRDPFGNRVELTEWRGA
jgi:extradiol dioxygenase family protein